MAWLFHYFEMAGRSRQIYDETNAEWRAAVDAWRAFCQEFGAEKMTTEGCLHGHRLRGLDFGDETAPEGWKRDAKCPIRTWVPDLRTAAGKALRKRIETLPVGPTLAQFTVRMFGDAIYDRRTGRRRAVSVSTLGDRHIICVPAANGEPPLVPPDGIPVTRPNYLRMLADRIEAAEAGDSQAAEDIADEDLLNAAIA